MRFPFPLLGLFVPLTLLAAEPEPSVLTETPVRVTLVIEPGGDGDTAVFHVGGDAGDGRVRTLPIAHDYSGDITWKPPYLHVRSVTGGNCWDCSGEAIFKIEGGKVHRLGDINDDVPIERVPAQAPGHFVTGYSKLELQAGFCHACSPFFMVGLADKDGKLEVDAEATWLLNSPLWIHVAGLIPQAAPAKEDEAYADWSLGIFRDLVSAAALARYCGREQQLTDLQALWVPFLDPESRDQLAEALDLVKPLEPVSAWNAVAPY